MKPTRFAPLLLLALAPCAVPGAAAAAAPDPDVRAIAAWRAGLDSLARADAFSGAALVARGDTVLFRGAWGEADRARHRPNRPDTRFNLGSINKVFTQLAIGQLVEQGRVRLDDTIGRYLPDLPRAIAAHVTVRELLEHRGGIADIFGPAYQRVDHATLLSVKDWVALVRDQPLRFEPGTREEYSNGGYVLLGAVIESASGESYYDYVRRHITGPLGMPATDHYARDENVPNRALGYTRGGEDFTNGPWRLNDATLPMRGSPAGGGYSTLDDLLRFANALRAGKLLRPETTRDGFEVFAVRDPRHMGLGLGGGAPGINAAFELAGPYTILVLANLDPPAAERAARALRERLPLPPVREGRRIGAGGARGAEEPGRVERRIVAPGAGGEDRAGSPRETPERTFLPESPVEVEMLRSGHLPVVLARVNGRGPFRFAIDTGGAGTARVDSALAATLGLQTVGQVYAGDPSGRRVPMDLVAVDSIEVGGARFAGLVAAVRRERLRSGVEPVDGILGFGLFHDCLLTLDYPGRRVRIERGALAEGDAIPYVERHGIPSVRLQVDTTWVDADVDAGSMGGFSLPDRLAAGLPLAAPPRVIGHARTVISEFDVRGARLKGSVRLGSLEFANPEVEFQPLFPMANIGARVLQDFRVTFDPRNHRLRLVRG